MFLIPGIISGIVDAVTHSGSATSGSANSGGTTGQTNAANDSQFKSLVAALTLNGKPVGGAVAATATTPSSATSAANAIVHLLIGKNAQLSETQRQLLDRINALLQNGTSMAQIVSTLASNLAQQVGTSLGKTDDASLATLKSAFASALSPPGSGPPDAATLLDRLRRTAKIATAALGNSTGQQNRYTGNTLDATAGGNPAPDQTQATANINNSSAPLSPQSIFASAFAALTGPIDSPQVAAQTLATAQTLAQAQTPVQAQTLAQAQAPAQTLVQPLTTAQAPVVLPQTASPSPSAQSLVAASSLDAAGTGGDTLLGRSLTRAANAAANVGPNPLAALSTPAAPILGSIASSGTSQQTSADAKGGSSPNSGGAALATALATANGAASAAPNGPVAAFLQTFQRALALNADPSAADALPFSQSQTDAAPAAADTTSVGSSQSFLASLGLSQDPQAPTSSSVVNTPVSQQTAPTTDPNAVVAQLVRGLTMSNLGTSSQIRLRLVPDNLGDLNVKLTVDSTGSVNASVLAQTPEARDTLLANQGQLHRSLSDAGLKLASFNVDLSNNGANMFGQQQPQPQAQQRFAFSQRSMDVSDDTQGDQLSAIPSFAPPSQAATAPGMLNYLA